MIIVHLNKLLKNKKFYKISTTIYLHTSIKTQYFTFSISISNILQLITWYLIVHHKVYFVLKN